MISGEFNERGELFFEIGLITADGDIIQPNLTITLVKPDAATAKPAHSL